MLLLPREEILLWVMKLERLGCFLIRFGMIRKSLYLVLVIAVFLVIIIVVIVERLLFLYKRKILFSFIS